MIIEYAQVIVFGPVGSRVDLLAEGHIFGSGYIGNTNAGLIVRIPLPLPDDLAASLSTERIAHTKRIDHCEHCGQTIQPKPDSAVILDFRPLFAEDEAT